MNPDFEHQPVQFEGSSNKKPRLQANDFRGKVPMVLTFVGAPDEQNDEIIQNLNASLIRFGERRVQLLVVIDGDPTVVSDRLMLNISLISDDGLAAELNANRTDEDPVVSIILGNDGMILDVVRQLPADDQAAAILVSVDRLMAEFPDRFIVLPTHRSDHSDHATPVEILEDPANLIPASTERLD